MNALPPKPAIRVEGLGKRFQIGIKETKESFLHTTRRLITGWSCQRDLWALRNINFEVGCGETLGIIGPNGAGKSTLLLLLAGILSPTEGTVRVSGRINCFFRLGAALQPGLTVLDNFSLCSALLGMSRREFRKQLPAMIDFSGLEEYLYARYAELSSGLAARLPFSAAVHSELDILLVDEMLSVGDQSFQAKCLSTFNRFRAQGKTLIVVSHSPSVIESMCSKVLYLNSGRTRFLGENKAAVRLLQRDLGIPVPSDAAPVPPRGRETRAAKPQAPVREAIVPESNPPAVAEERKATGADDPHAVWRKSLETRLDTLDRSLAGINKQFTDLLNTRDHPAAVEEIKPKEPSREQLYRALIDEIAGFTGISPARCRIVDWTEMKRHAFTAATARTALKRGDEVIVPMLYNGCLETMIDSGIIPVFADVDIRTWTITPAAVAGAFSSKTRGVFVSHLLGAPADIGPIGDFCRERRLTLIEDLDYTLGTHPGGRPVGTFSDLAVCRCDKEWSSLPLGGCAVLFLGDSETFLGERDPLFERCPHGLSSAQLNAGISALKHLPANIKKRTDMFEALNEIFRPYRDWLDFIPRHPSDGFFNMPGYPMILKENAPVSRDQLRTWALEHHFRCVVPFPMEFLPHEKYAAGAYKLPGGTRNTDRIKTNGVVFTYNDDYTGQKIEDLRKYLASL